MTLRLTVRSDIRIETPEFEVRRPLEWHSAGAAGYIATTGVASDCSKDLFN